MVPALARSEAVRTLKNMNLSREAGFPIVAHSSAYCPDTHPKANCGNPAVTVINNLRRLRSHTRTGPHHSLFASCGNDGCGKMSRQAPQPANEVAHPMHRLCCVCAHRDQNCVIFMNQLRPFYQKKSTLVHTHPQWMRMMVVSWSYHSRIVLIE